MLETPLRQEVDERAAGARSATRSHTSSVSMPLR